MTFYVGPAKPIRRTPTGIALAALFLLPLGGCMSSGASSFSQAGIERSEYGEMREVPLEVAISDAINKEPIGQLPESGDPTGLALAEPELEKIEADPLTTSALVPDETDLDDVTPVYGLKSREAIELREKTEARLASLSSSAESPSRLRNESLEPPVDPLEVSAERRIPALYASIQHGECKNGWGPKPRMVNAQRVDPAHKFYMEMRMRHTPLLPVGHVYIAYGRLGPDGQPIDEKLTMLSPLGGYAGAGIAAAVPMPGILTPIGSDCTIRPEAAYRITLSAQEFEKLLLAIKEQHEKKPNYHLFAYNCNHYLSEVAASVGILPPENIYQPSLTYLYALMDRNEGRQVPRTPAFAMASN